MFALYLLFFFDLLYNNNMKEIFDYAIFGGGVVGACLFNKLISLGKKVVLLEKNIDVATGQTKANSALIHAGFDAKPNTLKAILNVRGNQMYESLCKRLGIDYEKCGAIVVDKTSAIPQKLFQRGLVNGVKDLEIIEGQKLYELVPNLKKDYKVGLWAKSPGIVSPFMFAIAMCEEAVVNGGVVELGFDTQSIYLHEDVYTIKDAEREVFARAIINSAGYGYNRIAELLGEEILDIKFRRGEYFVLDNTAGNFVGLTVFPAPSDKGKGILATKTIDGNILFGPTADDCEYDTKTTTEALTEIRQGINNMFDNVPWKKVIRNYSGIRTIVGDDFYIKKGKNKNVINIAGICSPGLSSAPAISEYVCFELLGLKDKYIEMKPRPKYINTNKLALSEQDKLIKYDSQFGKIVCKCEMVSEGEILQAINSPIKTRSLDGIKRRVRAGMGRCQGGFCAMKVASLIAKEHNIKLENVLKENQESEISIGDFKNGLY